MSSSKIRLRDVCEAIVDCEHKTAPTQLYGIPLARTTDIDRGHLNLDSANRVSEETYRQWSKRLEPRAGDIILAREAPIGEVGIVPKGQLVCLGQRTVLIRADEKKICSKYLLYLLQTHQIRHEMESLAGGSVVPHLNIHDIRNLSIPSPPPLSLQEDIANNLGSLDDKVEINRQINNMLEEMIQMIFKSWFIHFDFPDKEKAYKSDGGEMINSELGPIPKGWRVEKLENYVKVVKGCSYKSSDLKESDTALVTLKSISRGGGFKPEGLKPYVGEYNQEQIVLPGELVVAHTDLTQKGEVLGKPAIVRRPRQFSTLVASLDLALVRPKDTAVIDSGFLYCLLKTDNFQDHAYGYANGTTVLHLNKKAIPDYTFVVPEADVHTAFNNLVKAIFNLISNNEEESYLLVLIRDMLLPKLLSDKIRIKAKNILNSET